MKKVHEREDVFWGTKPSPHHPIILTSFRYDSQDRFARATVKGSEITKPSDLSRCVAVPPVPYIITAYQPETGFYHHKEPIWKSEGDM